MSNSMKDLKDTKITEIEYCPFCHEKEKPGIWMVDPEDSKEHGDFAIMFKCGQTIHSKFLKTSIMIAKFKIKIS